MSETICKPEIRTADYFGQNRRYCIDRRVMSDRRRVVRFDHNGGDQRSGFARRASDQGLHEEDFS